MPGLKRNADKQAQLVKEKTDQAEKIKKIRAPADGLLWRFSFRFFKEIEYFGLKGKVESTWIISVLEKLKDLGDKKIDDLERDSAEADRWRYHPINWLARNIPVAKSDLNWIAEDYRNNDEEFPLMQFQISKARGRIIGFFDEDNVFQIVLLDPLHNMQPSKDYGYSVDPCSPLGCELTQLTDEIKDAITPDHMDCGCGVAEKVRLAMASKGYSGYPVLVLRVPDEGDLGDADDLIEQGKAKNYWAIFQNGIIALAD